MWRRAPLVLNVLLIVQGTVRTEAGGGDREEEVLEHVLVASCPRAAYKLGFKCFLESEQAMEWSKAAAFCSQLGGNLAVIDSAEEMTALKRDYLSSSVYLDIRVGDVKDVVEKTLKDNGYSGYTNFEHPRSKLKRCVAVIKNMDFSWNDVDCKNAYRALCEVSREEYLRTTRKSCKKGNLFDANTCFLTLPGQYNYTEGKQFCIDQGMQVASIHSKEENDWIKSQVEDNTWIGLEDMDGTVKDHYQWNDLTSFDFDDWDDIEPSHIYGSKDENCVHMRKKVEYRWNDFPCDARMQVLCRGQPEEELV